MTYREQIKIRKNDVSFYNSLLQMNGNEIYNKYGLKRDEKPCALTAQFDNGYEMDINLIICEEDTPYIDTVLFNATGNEMSCEIGEGNIDDEYYLKDDGDEYYVTVVAEV